MSTLSFVWIWRHLSGDICFPLTCPFRSFKVTFSPRNHQYDLQFWWLASELSHHARGNLNKYAPLFQACCSVFARNILKDLLNSACEMPVVLIFDICNVYGIVAYDWLFSQYSGQVKMVDMALKFLGNIDVVCVNWSWRVYIIFRLNFKTFIWRYVFP